MNISVIIPVYNAAAFLRKAVESAVQLAEVKEILLVEDCSTDNSLQICRELEHKYPKVKFHRHPDNGNHGAGATRNLGLEKATQEFTAFLDADDWYLPNRFVTDAELFQNPETEGVFNAIGTAFLSEKGKAEFREKFKDTVLTTVKKAAEGKDVFYGLLGLDQSFGTFFHLNGLTVRTAALRKNRLKFNENLKVHQDTDFIVKLSWHCHLKSGNITEPVAVRGVHDNNRITKIKRYTLQYNQRQYLLWDSIAKWSVDKKIENRYNEHIHLTRFSFKAGSQTGLKKWVTVGTAVLKNPRILRTRYRFTYLGL